MRGYALRRVAFCVRKMPNVLIAAYVLPRALPWARGNNWTYSPPQSFAKNRGILRMLELIGAGVLQNAPTREALICKKRE